MSQPKPRSINIELPADLDLTHAASRSFPHTPSEVIFDLAQLLPNQPKVRVRTKSGHDAAQCKADAASSRGELAKYEAAFGEIVVPGQCGDDLDRSFFGGKIPPETE